MSASARQLASSIGVELEALASRCEDGSTLPVLVVQDALERGFASLISLEACVHRLRRRADVIEQKLGDASSRDELEQQIGSLRQALKRLESLAVPEPSAPLALGFVLPRPQLAVR
jgi:hypothetical protein